MFPVTGEEEEGERVLEEGETITLGTMGSFGLVWFSVFCVCILVSVQGLCHSYYLRLGASAGKRHNFPTSMNFPA